MNHRGCIAGNLAAVTLWLLFLRKGRIGTVASGLRAFDQLNQPARRPLLDRPVLLSFYSSMFSGLLIMQLDPCKGIRAEREGSASVPDPPQPADETANTLPPEDPETNAPNDKEGQKDTPTAEDKDRNSENDKN